MPDVFLHHNNSFFLFLISYLSEKGVRQELTTDVMLSLISLFLKSKKLLSRYDLYFVDKIYLDTSKYNECSCINFIKFIYEAQLCNSWA